MQNASILTVGVDRSTFYTTTFQVITFAMQDKGNWNNLTQTLLKSQYTGFSDRNQFLLDVEFPPMTFIWVTSPVGSFTRTEGCQLALI